jgi:Flp pilus assembly protein TadD
VRGVVVVLLTLTTLLVYLPLTRSDFVTFDDMTYVVDNPHVRNGLTLKGVAWAMTACAASNWHPVTWISHMGDVTLFGISPGFHHGTNIVLHIASVVALFLLLTRITGETAPSAVVASLFAIHPLHVESVAWVAERKDVLSTLFGIASIAAYCRYATTNSGVLYAAAVSLFALSLMSKPMLVTLPCLLVLLDYWPLRRLTFFTQGVAVRQVVIEKLPFLALSAASSAITLLAQHRGGAVVSTDAVPIMQRLANATVAYVAYIAKAFYPVNLAIFYPHPSVVPAGIAICCAAAIGGVTAVVLRNRRRMPEVAVGWLWYLGTLVPVIGIVQVGSQSMADRYMYFPLIGLSIVVVWWAWDAAQRAPRGKFAFVAAATICVAILVPVARRQVSYWKDSETLFTHAMSVTGDNSKMLYCRGIDSANRGKWARAETDFTNAITLAPSYAKAYLQRGVVYHNVGNQDGAIADFTTALTLNPDDAEAYNNRGNVLSARGDHQRAITDLQRACELNPSGLFYNNLGSAYANSKDHESAVRCFTTACGLSPRWTVCLVNRGQSHAAMKRYSEAIADFTSAIALAPNLSTAWLERAAVFDTLGDRANVCREG